MVEAILLLAFGLIFGVPGVVAGRYAESLRWGALLWPVLVMATLRTGSDDEWTIAGLTPSAYYVVTGVAVCMTAAGILIGRSHWKWQRDRSSNPER